MTIPGDLQPVAVWDARHRDWNRWEHWREAENWAAACGLSSAERGHPRSQTYRIELYLIDGPFARCFRYAKDAAGQPHLDRPGGTVQLDAPEDVTLAGLPPGHLLRTEPWLPLEPPDFPDVMLSPAGRPLR
jgi:hypothetical protein